MRAVSQIFASLNAVYSEEGAILLLLGLHERVGAIDPRWMMQWRAPTEARNDRETASTSRAHLTFGVGRLIGQSANTSPAVGAISDRRASARLEWVQEDLLRVMRAV